jgi:secreted trypsin-like serine protease
LKLFNSLRSVFALVVLATLAGCSPSQNHSIENTQATSIIGGTPVTAEDVIEGTTIPSTIGKSTVAIVILVQKPNLPPNESLMQLTCTGTLLSNNIVLTAGHCVYQPRPGEETESFIIFKDDLNAPEEADVRVVTRAIVHPDFGKSGQRGQDMNDVALLQFKGDMAPGYQVAKLLEDESLLKKGSIVTLAGYGVTDGVKKTSDRILRKVDVKVLGPFGKTETALDQSHGKGACHGDSGGPAFITVDNTEYFWGLTSRGIGKDGADDCSLFAIYTRVSAQAPFIQSALTTLSN